MCSRAVSINIIPISLKNLLLSVEPFISSPLRYESTYVLLYTRRVVRARSYVRRYVVLDVVFVFSIHVGSEAAAAAAAIYDSRNLDK